MKVYLLYAEPDECFGLQSIHATLEEAKSAAPQLLRDGPPADLSQVRWVVYAPACDVRVKWYGWHLGHIDTKWRIEEWDIQTTLSMCNTCAGACAIYNHTYERFEDCPTCLGRGFVTGDKQSVDPTAAASARRLIQAFRDTLDELERQVGIVKAAKESQ